jgi:hypothetical protein
MTYPLLERDPSREALTEPSKIIRPRDVPEHAVICPWWMGGRAQ